MVKELMQLLVKKRSSDDVGGRIRANKQSFTESLQRLGSDQVMVLQESDEEFRKQMEAVISRRQKLHSTYHNSISHNQNNTSTSLTKRIHFNLYDFSATNMAGGNPGPSGNLADVANMTQVNQDRQRSWKKSRFNQAVKNQLINLKQSEQRGQLNKTSRSPEKHFP